MTERRLVGLLRKAGRQRGIDTEAALLCGLLRANQLRQPVEVEDAMGVQLRGLVSQLEAVMATITALEAQIDTAFAAHPDARIASFPGLGVALGSRILAEVGDDHGRFDGPRALKAFAGAAPVTRAPGRSSFVHALRKLFNCMLGKLYHHLMTGQTYDPDRAFHTGSESSAPAEII